MARPAHLLGVLALVFSALVMPAGVDANNNDPQRVAGRFLDAFYAWDSFALDALLSHEAEGDDIRYYQGWAQGANYQVVSRPPCEVADTDDSVARVICAVTVTDDFGRTLGYQATDTFRLTIENEQVLAASFSGDDPPIFAEVFDWIQQQRPEILSGPCHLMFAGGSTPNACAKAVARAAEDYMRNRASPEDKE